MQSSGVVGARRLAVLAPHKSLPTYIPARLYTSNFGKANMDAEPLESEQSSSTSNGASTSPLSSAASSQSLQRYRRRSSDPQTPRERADFRRDHKYGKHRPLLDAPWRQMKTKTYLDDAERLYGRKETWHTVEDATLRERLVAILQDYLRDTLSAARLESKDARKYLFLCSTAAKHYRARVSSGAFGLPDDLQEWARGVAAGRAFSAPSAESSTQLSMSPEIGDTGTGADVISEEKSDALTPSHVGVAHTQNLHSRASSPSQEEREAAVLREERRLRAAKADLTHTVAMEDLPDADSRRSPHSAFPFLRRRAVENEATLDPSLVDWTAKYFPEDDAATFTEPPRLRVGMIEDAEASVLDHEAGDGSQEGGVSNAKIPGTVQGGRPSGFAPAASPLVSRRVSIHAHHRLRRTLRDHENRNRATFDAEGIYYKVHRQSEADERAPKPQQVKASDLEAPGRRPDVVKVPWSVAAKAKAQGYSSETLRAKERIVRLTRGENPETIP